MKSVQRFETHSAEETQALGRQLAEVLPQQAVVLLVGDLGAGKTTLTKGIVQGRNAASADDVSSPTFTLIHEYGSPVSVYHADLYRLDTAEQVRRLGLDEMFDRPALTLVEWGERFPEIFPAERIEIYLRDRGGDDREIEILGALPISRVTLLEALGSHKRMDTVKAELVEFESAKDLKQILGAEGPCITIYMPLAEGTPNQAQKANSLEWRELLRTLEQKAEALGAVGRELLSPLSDFESLIPEGEAKGESLAIFRSANLFRIAWVNERLPSRAVLGPHFFVRPMLREITTDGQFYILALSKKNVRLLRCTLRTSEDVPLPEATSTNYDEYMDSVKPDHDLENRASGGPDMGAGGVLFGTAADSVNKNDYLAHFYRQVDNGLNEVLRGKTEPVVLAGVDYELPLYRSVSKFPHLAKEAVHGAPNSLKAGEMHTRAIEAIRQCYSFKVDHALAEYDHKVGGGATNRLKEVVTAAHDGRVLTLLVSDSLETTGVFDETTHTVKGRQTGTSEDEDLVNDAVVQTILHAGQVFVAPNAKMPHGSPMAAIFRY